MVFRFTHTGRTLGIDSSIMSWTNVLQSLMPGSQGPNGLPRVRFCRSAWTSTPCTSCGAGAPGVLIGSFEWSTMYVLE